MVDISTYGLQIIRAPDVIFLGPKWQLKCPDAGEGKKSARESENGGNGERARDGRVNG